MMEYLREPCPVITRACGSVQFQCVRGLDRAVGSAENRQALMAMATFVRAS